MDAELLLRSEGPILAAFSGGGDSLGMLVLLVQERGPSDLAAVYVDHGVRSREELEAEIALNRANCQKLGVRFEVRRLLPAEVARRAAVEGKEGALRALRYEALERARLELGFRWIATAHTLDDQAETVLMRLLSGKAPSSLRGIPPVNGAVIRPVLDMGRRELEDVCRKAGLRWSVDSTNASDSYLRNRIRHRLVPEIEALFPSWREALGAFASMMGSFEDGGPTAREAAEGLPLERFSGLSDLAADILLHRFWSLALGERFVSLSRSLARRILDAARDGSPAYIASGGAVAEIRGGRLLVEPEWDRPFYFELDLGLEGEAVPLPGGRTLLRGTAADPSKADDQSVRIPEGRLDGGLVVRSARGGDAIALKDGRKLVSDLLREMGIPRCRRPLVPVLADRSEIVAVLGRAYGGRDRICRKCRANLAANLLSLYIVE